jgi:hypothetical protein
MSGERNHPPNRQGSASNLPAEAGARLSAAEREIQDQAREIYNERLAAGVAREQARKDLPLSTYTEAYWKCDLHNLLHSSTFAWTITAQYEIRAYANHDCGGDRREVGPVGLGGFSRLSPAQCSTVPYRGESGPRSQFRDIEELAPLRRIDGLLAVGKSGEWRRIGAEGIGSQTPCSRTGATMELTCT